MPQTDSAVSLGGCAPVADRLTLFYARFPMGRVVTELVSHSETQVVFRALVYRSLDETEPSATGWAAERIGDGDINTVACVENTETSAVGRALANLGLTASSSRPSREEMEKASRARLAARPRAPAPAADAASSEPPGIRAPVLPNEKRTPPLAATSPGIRVVRETGVPPLNASLQQLAGRVNDVFALIDEAERMGLPVRSTRPLRQALRERSVAPSTVEQTERLLRKWLAERTERVLQSAAAYP